MKVVHTFSNHYPVIWKEELYVQWLSAVLAKNAYGNITLFTTKEIADYLEEFKLPYSEVVTDVLEQSEFATFSIPKLQAYKHFKGECLHIDLDTLIFDKVPFDKKKVDVVFNAPDFEYGDDFLRPFFKTSSDAFLLAALHDEPAEKIAHLFPEDHLVNMHDSYVSNFVKLGKHLEHGAHYGFKMDEIPNMNTVYNNNSKDFYTAVELALKHYNWYKETIDESFYGACYIEQLVIHLYLKAISPEYAESITTKQNILFKGNPIELINQKYVPDYEEWEYPFSIRALGLCSCCSSSKESFYKVENEDQLARLLETSFEGFLHLGSNMKNFDFFQAYTINHLIKIFGEDRVLDFHKKISKVEAHHERPIISSGELLYEKLTGNKIFSNGKSI